MSGRRYSIVVALLATVAFVVLGRLVAAGELLPLDNSVRNWVHNWTSPVLTQLLFGITMLGSEWVMLPLGAALVWWLAAARRVRHGILLIAGTLIAESLSNVLKWFGHRPRPQVFFGLPPAETYSFPSGHALVSVVFYGLLAGIFIHIYGRARGAIITGFMGITLLIGISRVYLGYHYPTDVAGGWICGIAFLSVVRLLLGAPPVDGAQQSHE